MKSETGNGDGFLARWSTRKQAAGSPVETPLDDKVQSEVLNGLPHAQDAVDQAVVPEESSAAPDQQQAPLLTDEDMPAVESLSANSDISGFLNKGVSAALRRAALRHVFHQAEYNVRDGLNDYDGDYTVFEPLGDTVTADMKFHAARKERERLEAEQAEAEQAEAEQAEAEQAEAEQAEAEQAEAEQAEAEQAEAEQAEAEQLTTQSDVLQAQLHLDGIDAETSGRSSNAPPNTRSD